MTGWLNREARFYSCEWGQHDTFALEELKVKPVELEDRGWVKVLCAVKEHVFGPNAKCYLHTKALSNEQEGWLLANGYELEGEPGRLITPTPYVGMGDES